MGSLPLRAKFEIIKNSVLKSAGGYAGILGFSRAGSSGKYTTQALMLQAYEYMPWLRAVFGKIADGTSSAVWYIQAAKSNKSGKHALVKSWGTGSPDQRKHIRNILTKDHEIREIFDHPLTSLMGAPNPFMQGPTLIWLTTLHLDLVGEALWYIEEENGVPIGLWPIPPSWVAERPDSTHGVFRINATGFPQNDKAPLKNITEIPMEKIVWFRMPSPSQPYKRTVGTGGPLSNDLEIDEYAAQHMKAFFLNGARPDILITGTGLSREEAEDAEERWIAKLRGVWKAHRPHFIAAEARVIQLTNSFSDLDLMPLRKWQRDIVLQAAGMPPEILGVLESSNRATIDTAAFIFARWVLTPRLELVRATIQQQLLPMFDPRLVLEYLSPVEEDREYRMKVMEIAPWAWTVDNWRTVVGDAPLKNGGGDYLMVPATMVPTLSTELSEFVSPYTQQGIQVSDPGSKSFEMVAKLLQLCAKIDEEKP